MTRATSLQTLLAFDARSFVDQNTQRLARAVQAVLSNAA
jgi:hypothetical protein